MNDLIQRIVNAILRQEGMSPDHANPGNLRDCPWFPKNGLGKRQYINDPSEPVQYAGGFWVPRSRAEGVAGAAHVVALHIAEGNSLTTLISIWAPASDSNNTQAYIANVQQWAGIPDVNLPLWNYILDLPVT
jgi:hypothetical protein